MAEQTTIFQNVIFSQFILPFLLVFIISFAILQRSKILGDGKKQLDAIVAFVIGLIFVGVAGPKQITYNLILFLVLAVIVIFVALLLWGFLTAGEAKVSDSKLKWVGGSLIVIAVIIAVFWAAGYDWTDLNTFFNSNLNNSFWTNFVFILVIAGALAIVLTAGKAAAGGKG